MAASDIYEVKESPWAAPADQKPSSSGNRRRSRRTFSQASDRDLSKTHERRSGNSGFRRLLHLMRKKRLGGKFWLMLLAGFGAVLALVIVWDTFFRYPDNPSDAELPAAHAAE